jgi:diguanylate cyclase (GGDEF)-like protein
MAKAKLRERFTGPWLSLRGVGVVTVVAIAVLCAACLSVLLQSRLELVRRADILAGDVLMLADQTVQIEVRRSDLRLLDVISDRHDAAAASPAAHGNLSLSAWLFGGLALRNSTGDIMVLDERGRVLASSRPDLTADYAGALSSIMAGMSPQSSGLGISTVLLGGGGQPLLALTRRCSANCGQAAVIVATLPMAWIQGVFDGLVLGRRGAIALTDGSGTLLARQPALPSILGHSFEPPSIIARIPSAGATVFRWPSVADGRCCRVTAGRIYGLPLLVFVSISRADMLRGWSHLAFIIILAVVVLSGGLVALNLLLAQQVHRKMQVDRQLVLANTRLAELARTDGLTGLLNRRGFDEALEREWRRCRRSGNPIGLLMLDADHFKAYNDGFGHQAGDSVLRTLAGCILPRIHAQAGIAARYGGEEFTIVLPDSDLAAARLIAEAIRAGIEALAIPCGRGDAVVTVSIGVSFAAAGEPATAEALVAAADAALYESKDGGRNRVTVRGLAPQPAGAQAPA